ncbi:MAG: hypothetical protein C5B49_03815 [Bdellovibrio sp.]|nr:MAG: hypothetical protein C5B49_03815 [Bdellovibrio sp.]
MAKKFTPRRRLRYRPESTSVATIHMDDRSSGLKIAALIENESYQGCCLLTLKDHAFKFDHPYRISLTNELDLQAEVRWMKRVGDVALLVGFEYLDK